jgi:hypothetical protein
VFAVAAGFSRRCSAATRRSTWRPGSPTASAPGEIVLWLSVLTVLERLGKPQVLLDRTGDGSFTAYRRRGIGAIGGAAARDDPDEGRNHQQRDGNDDQG